MDNSERSIPDTMSKMEEFFIVMSSGNASLNGMLAKIGNWKLWDACTTCTPLRSTGANWPVDLNAPKACLASANCLCINGNTIPTLLNWWDTQLLFVTKLFSTNTPGPYPIEGKYGLLWIPWKLFYVLPKARLLKLTSWELWLLSKQTMRCVAFSKRVTVYSKR